MTVLPAFVKTLHLWFPGYLESRRHRRLEQEKAAGLTKTVWLLIADHYEPYWSKADDHKALERVLYWKRHWPKVAARHRDSAGRAPQYTFFYPDDEYRPHLMQILAELKDEGIADVEVQATGASSGAEVIWNQCQVWTFRDGKVIRWSLFKERAEALKAVGLEE